MSLAPPLLLSPLLLRLRAPRRPPGAPAQMARGPHTAQHCRSCRSRRTGCLPNPCRGAPSRNRKKTVSNHKKTIRSRKST
eukprot:7547299-Alexandrium_andersonii.AAC.1